MADQTDDSTCPRCHHILADHSQNTGMCSWSNAGFYCKCLGPDQATRVETWPRTIVPKRR